MQNRLKFLRHRMESRMQMLDSLSPLRVLGRGYSITEIRSASESHQILQSINAVTPGDLIQTRLTDGIIESKVISKSDEKLIKTPIPSTD